MHRTIPLSACLALLLALVGLGPSRPLGEAAAAELELGVSGHPLGQEGYRQVPLATQLEWVRRLGAGWYRCDWGASAARPEGMAGLDRLVEEADRRKIHLLPILFPPVDLKREDDEDRIRRAAFDYASTVVEHFKKSVTHWELHNELDGFAMIHKGERTIDGTLWQWGDPAGDRPAHYQQARYRRARAVLRGLADGVRAADPAAVRVINTGGWLHTGFVERLQADRVPFEILSWHWYSEMGDIARAHGNDNLLAELARFGKPIWITEWNRRGGSLGASGEAEQADYLRQSLLRFRELAAEYPLEAVFVYELFDEPYFGPHNPESHYGLIRLEKNEHGLWTPAQPKPALAMLRDSFRP